jgi:membrane protein
MGALQHMRQSLSRIIADNSKTNAKYPRRFQPKDWKNVLFKVNDDLKDKRIGILAASVAYFSTLAVFPAIAAIVGILSFALHPAQVQSLFHSIETYLPSDIAGLITSQLSAALENPKSGIILIVVGILVSLFSLSGAVSNIISATNAIYERTESRKFVKLRLTSIAFIIAGGAIAVITAGLLALNDSLLESVGLPDFLTTVVLIIRWLVIASLVAVTLAAFYRYAPDRATPRLRWVTWGSSIATVLWLLGTTLFFIYARYFAHFTSSYSVFAGIIVLMLWLNLSAFAILIGAEINYRLEGQTRAKTAAP